MKRSKIRWLMIDTALCCRMLAGQAEAAGFFETYLQGHLEVGARITRFRLKDDYRGGDNTAYRQNFLGSIWGLDEKQRYLPKPYVQYALGPYGGWGLSYDELNVRTVDWSDPEAKIKGSDGTLDAMGPAFYLYGRYPNATRLTPFAELGWVHYFTDFKETAAWVGDTPGRYFEVEDTDAWYVGLGCSVRMVGPWQGQVYYRRLRGAEVDALAHFGSGYRPRPGAFPVDYDSFGAGVSFQF